MNKIDISLTDFVNMLSSRFDGQSPYVYVFLTEDDLVLFCAGEKQNTYELAVTIHSTFKSDTYLKAELAYSKVMNIVAVGVDRFAVLVQKADGETT